MNQIVRSFGTTVRQLREQQDWSQEMLAERSDLNRSYIGELERGQAIPSLLTIQKLGLAFGVSLSHLLSHAERIAQTRMLRGIELTAIAC
ncbi:helix-turn-helix transcriptional regulator [Rhodoferax sp.]|uniref:helix-turn-helix domain-containing protein n=1 Tax=Rhodoferax sp. TaxID=50421 RepID=UPI00261D5E03|nr:helix-turn-helix transcriptional regulator [Rhodoferax sp.]MDD2927207.1 helix-turn-helix transcriptional regulator [Rhodoferax sp.]